MHTNNKINVLQVLPSLKSGGVERGTVDIAEALVKNDMGSFVASSGGVLVSAIEKSGAVHYILPLKSKNPWHIYKNIAKLVEIIKKEKISIVHARSRAPAWSAYFAAKATGCKFITTFHGSYGMQNRFKIWYNSIMTRGEKVIAVSSFIKKYICKFYPAIDERVIKVIHRGVDTDVFSPTNVNYERLNILSKQINFPDDKVIITMPARITRWKGHLDLVKALALLDKIKFHCFFVGDLQNNHNYYNEILELMGKHGLDNNITFSASVRDMPALYMLSDIIVAPSNLPEAFGRIPIEAGAMAKIIIATNIGGCKETVLDNETGFLVPPNDSKSLARAIDKIMGMSIEERTKIGQKARQHIIENFSLDRMVRETLDLYRS